MPEALAIMRQQRRVVAQQLQASEQQLAEVDQSAALAGELIALVEIDHLHHVGIAVGIDLMRTQPLFLAARDERLHLTRRIALVVDAVVLEQSLDQPELVIAVDDLKVLGQAGVLPVGTQQPMSDGVKGADPHMAQRQAQQSLEASTHLPGGLVGEGHRQHGVGREPFSLHQPGNAMHQHPGLSRTGPGQHQHIALGRADGLALGRIQVVENRRDIIHGESIAAGKMGE